MTDHHTFFPPVFYWWTNTLYFIFSYYVISIYLHKDLYAKTFYSSYLQCRTVWYGPYVNIHNKNLVEQNHLHNWNRSCASHFPGSVPGSNSTECWCIPQVWWVQILPKETPLSVVNEKHIISPSLLPTTPKGAKLDCHSPSAAITFPRMKLQNNLTNFLFLPVLLRYNWHGTFYKFKA